MSTREALQEQAYRQIKQKIIDGVLRPERRLSEPQLAEMFGVSRSPIREAILRLERDGFVVRSGSGRISVAPLDLAELEQLFTVRASLEGLATRLATDRLRPIDFDEMSRSLERNRACLAKKDFLGGVTAGQVFHDVILRECANAPLLDLVSQLKGRMWRFRSLAASFDDYDSVRLVEHDRVLDALKKRQPARAEAEMINHIIKSGLTLLGKLRPRQATSRSAARMPRSGKARVLTGGEI